MRLRPFIVILGLSVLGTGCSMYESGIRTLICEPCKYPTNVEDYLMRLRNRHLAKAVWKDLRKYNCEREFSKDYARGFTDGFADYLDAGGTGQPPPVPPRCYWKIQYQTPEGARAMDDWFAGFRHGALTAQESGYREQIVIPPQPPRDIETVGLDEPASEAKEEMERIPEEGTPEPRRLLAPPKDSSSMPPNNVDEGWRPLPAAPPEG